MYELIFGEFWQEVALNLVREAIRTRQVTISQKSALQPLYVAIS